MRAINMLHGLTSFIDRLLVLIFALGLVTYELAPSLFEGLSLRELAARWPNWGVWAGVVLVVLNILPLMEVALRGRGQGGYLHSGSGSGPARVSLQAVRRSLRAAAQSVPGVSKVRLLVQRLGPRHYRVGARYWIGDSENAIAVGERLRLVLDRRLAELVSLDPKNRVDIEVSLAGLIGRTSGSPGGQVSRGPSSGFHGPVYPVASEADEGEGR